MSLAIPTVELVGMTSSGSGGIQCFKGYKMNERALSNIPDTVERQISVHNQLGLGNGAVIRIPTRFPARAFHRTWPFRSIQGDY